MNIPVEVVRNSEKYSRIPKEELPEIEAYRDLKGNVVYIVRDDHGREIVLDRYFIVRDVDGVVLFTNRESRFAKRLRHVFEGVASVLQLLGSAKIKAIFAVLGLDYNRLVKDRIDQLGDLVDSEKVRILVTAFGGPTAERIREKVKEALEDGVLTKEEWAEIKELARKARVQD